MSIMRYVREIGEKIREKMGEEGCKNERRRPFLKSSK
jgi:hypothetical protein